MYILIIIIYFFMQNKYFDQLSQSLKNAFKTELSENTKKKIQMGPLLFF